MVDSLSFLIEGRTPQEIFMPEGKCARCGEADPEFDFLFDIKVTSLPSSQTKLGFCSSECLTAFCGGIEGARSMKI